MTSNQQPQDDKDCKECSRCTAINADEYIYHCKAFNRIIKSNNSKNCVMYDKKKRLSW